MAVPQVEVLNLPEYPVNGLLESLPMKCHAQWWRSVTRRWYNRTYMFLASPHLAPALP